MRLETKSVFLSSYIDPVVCGQSNVPKEPRSSSNVLLILWGGGADILLTHIALVGSRVDTC